MNEQMDPLDVAALTLSIERAKSAQLAAQLTQAQMALKYAMSSTDKLNVDTGEIIRCPSKA